METPQISAVTPVEIHAWLTEIRDLKNTIAALRGLLEQEKIDKEKCLQDALGGATARSCN